MMTGGALRNLGYIYKCTQLLFFLTNSLHLRETPVESKKKQVGVMAYQPVRRMPPKIRKKSLGELMGGNKIEAQLQHDNPCVENHIPHSQASISQNCNSKGGSSGSSGQLLTEMLCVAREKLQKESLSKEKRIMVPTRHKAREKDSIAPGHGDPLGSIRSF